jgi:ribA/ribD-fused uncharacterized protein
MAAEPTTDELRRFYDERSKPSKRERFQIDKQGNLAEYDTKRTLIKTIVLPTYRPPTEPEIKDMEEERIANIAAANRVFEDARRSLYQALQDGTSRRGDILDLNRSVRDADILLQKARFPLRSVHSEGHIKIKSIDFNQMQETRVFPYSIAFTEVRPFTLQQQYVRIGDIPLPQMVSLAEAQQANMPAETVILVSDQNMEMSPYGILALGWTVAIPYKEKMYKSARHAIFAELAREFNPERADAIQNAESSSDIRYTIDDTEGGRAVNQMKWNTTLSRLIDEVNLVKFKQYPELRQRLMDLPSPLVIGAYEPNDTYMGIGLSIDNVKAKDKLAWTGENLLGKALMKIRENFIAERAQLVAESVKRPRKPRGPPKAASTSVQGTTPMGVAPPLLPPNVGVTPMSLAQLNMASAAPVSSVAQMTNTVPVAAPIAAPVASVRRGPRIAPRAQPQVMPQAMPQEMPQEKPFVDDHKYDT